MHPVCAHTSSIDIDSAIRQFERPIQRLTRKYTKRWPRALYLERADEIHQAARLKLSKVLPLFDQAGGSTLEAWAVTAIKWAIIHECRNIKAERAGLCLIDDHEELAGSLKAAPRGRVSIEDLINLDELTTIQRRLLLIVLEDPDPRVVAEKLGTTVKGAYERISRLRKIISARLAA